MNLFGRRKKETGQRTTHHLGGCIVTKSLLEGTSRLRWLFREDSCNPADNGWRAIGDEYLDDVRNSVVVDFDRLVEIEPAVLAVYDLPVGTDLEFDGENRVFRDSETGEVTR